MRRRLGGSELVMWHGGRVGSANFAAVARVRGTLEERELVRAVRQVVERHPLLSARIEADPEPCFRPSEEPVGVQVLPMEGERHWEACVTSAIDRSIDAARGPLAHVIALRGPAHFDLICIGHHAICDGRSGAIVVRELLEALAGGARPRPDTWQPPANLEERLRHRRAPVATAAAAVLKQLPWLTWRRARQLASGSDSPDGPVRQGVAHRTMGAGDTSRLVQACRDRGIHVTAAIEAALLSSIAQALGGEDPIPLSCFTPVDARRLLDPPPRDEVGMFASFTTTYALVAPSPAPGGLDWSLARALHAQIRRAMEGDDIFATIWLQSKVVDPAATLEDFLRRTKSFTRTSAGVTNLGNIELPKRYGEYELEGLHFVGASHLAGACLAAAVSGFDGRLFFNFFYAKPAIGDAAANLHADRIIATLAATRPASACSPAAASPPPASPARFAASR